MENHWEIVKKAGMVAANTPEQLFEQSCEYFKWCDEHPIKTKKRFNAGKKAGEAYDDETPRPYNLKALCLHTGLTEEYIRDIRNTKDLESDYYHVVSRILYIIYVQNYELAVVGVFNPIMVGRMLNLGVDDTPAGNVKVEIIGNGIPLSNTENEVLEKLELENDNGRIVEF